MREADGVYTTTDLATAADLLRAAKDVTLLAHVDPDADALGSALALGLALHRRGTPVRVSFGSPAEVPQTLRDLDTVGLLVPAGEVPPASAVVVTMDASSVARLGALGDRVAATVAAGGAVLVVDHHASNTWFGTHHVVDERAEATAVLVLRLLDEFGEEVDEPIARCLYAGLVTDTSSFRRATPDTHRMAARLLAAGVDPDAMARTLMSSHPFAWLGMLSVVLGRAVLDPAAAGGLGLVHTVVYLSDIADVRPEDVDRVIDIVCTTVESEVAGVLKEVAPGRWSGSLRATGRVDVSRAAVLLGGGGHRLAAGFTAEGSAEEVLAALRTALDEPVLIK
jgi:phosphoesterase RecJ-like protein